MPSPIKSVPLLAFDLIKGSGVRNYYGFIKKAINWDREEILRYQTEKLKRLITYAYHHSPWYKDLFDKLGLQPGDINSISDLSGIPPLSRSDLQIASDRILSKESDKLIFSSGSSSGTTGIPVRYHNDRAGYSAGVGAGYFIWSCSGWEPGKRSVHIWGNPQSIGKWQNPSSRIKRKLFRQLFIPSVHINSPSEIACVVEKIRKFRPFSVDGYTSSIYNLSEYILNNNIKIDGIKAVFSTAENLTDYQRGVIEQALGPVSDTYGFGEINSVAVKPVFNDKFYVIEPHVIVETEDIPGTDLKEIVVTDLDNMVFPFIRYKPGDMISDIMMPEAGDKIQFRTFKNLCGRTSEVIELPNGMKMHPINLFGGTLFRRTGGVVKHKVLWNGRSLVFRFVTDGNFNEERMKAAIAEVLREYGVEFTIEQVSSLDPSETGKYKYFERISS